MIENQKDIEKYNYEYLKEMENHAKNYDFVSDKKDFLRNVSPYEQKIILLQSKNPYEVLSYLDELDIKQTRELLSELTYDEISDILLLFSSEDKEKFYSTFSDLSLVNQFMVHDKNASEYVDDLTFDRKVDLIDASTQETVEATSKVYETIPDSQKEYAASLVDDSDAVSALSVAEDSIAISKNESNDQKENYTKESDKNIQSKIQKDVQQMLNQKEEQQKENKIEVKPEITKSENKENLQTEKIVELKQDNKENKEIETNVNPPIPQSSNTKDNSENLESFKEAKQLYEDALINKIKQEIIVKNNNNEFDKENQITKTL